MAKSQEKIKARALRSKGESIKKIAKILGVSSSTASLWCRDVKLTQKQIENLEKQARDPHYGRRLEYSLSQQRQREQKTKLLLEEGIKDVDILSKRELFLAGISLYWAEGFKKDSQVGFSNSDPAMITFFMKWLFICCNYSVADIRLRVSINSNHMHRVNEIMTYWSEKTEVPLTSFQKPFYQKTAWKKVYENPENYYGVLRIRVLKSTDFLRKIHGWIDGLRKNSEFTLKEKM